MANPLVNFVDNVYKTYSSNPGKMLIHTGIVGWVMSSAAQILAIAVNDKISKKEKLFMIPQEFADALTNIASFYLVTRTFTAVANKLVSSGKWLPANLVKTLKDAKLGDKIGKADFDIFKHLKGTDLTEAKKWNCGVDFGATLVGSVLSCNFITPVVRNIYASHRQKKSLARLEEHNNIKNNEFVNEYFRPTMATFYGKESIYPTMQRRNNYGALKV